MPPIGDTVKGYEAVAWIGLGAPKGTPPEIVATLNKQINAALLDATIQKRLADLGATPLPPMPPAEFGKICRRRRRQMGQGDQGDRHEAGAERASGVR